MVWIYRSILLAVIMMHQGCSLIDYEWEDDPFWPPYQPQTIADANRVESWLDYAHYLQNASKQTLDRENRYLERLRYPNVVERLRLAMVRTHYMENPSYLARSQSDLAKLRHDPMLKRPVRYLAELLWMQSLQGARQMALLKQVKKEKKLRIDLEEKLKKISQLEKDLGERAHGVSSAETSVNSVQIKAKK